MDEALIILSDGAAIAAVEAVAPVRQRFGDRVLLVSADAAPRLAGVAGADTFLPGGAPAVPPPAPSEIERIGVEAWNARVASRDKPRAGDGLAWDTPGFEAP